MTNDQLPMPSSGALDWSLVIGHWEFPGRSAFRIPHSASRNRGGAIWAALLLLLLAACAHPPAPVRSVSPAAPGVSEVGRASWYGAPYHGRRTSSGEVYDMYQMTAAHRELPLGTWIMVTNLENGRSVEIRVNDRGPFVPDRIVDVSYAAGRLLGMIGPGVIPVRLTITRLPSGDPGEPVGLAARYTVQVGSFTSPENAQALMRSLVGGSHGAEVVRRQVGSEAYYRVWVGNFPSRGDALAAAEQLARRGLAVLVVERGR